MSTLITVLHVIVCLFLVLTVLLQSGKSGGMGAIGGGGNASTVFGGGGASSFLKRMTAVAGSVFMVTSMILAFIASHNSADALEKYGEDQQKLADAKETARKKAMGAGSGSAGSGSAALTPSMGSNGPTIDLNSGSSQTIQLTPPSNGSNGGATGNAVTPAETPIPAGQGGAEVKPNPATPAGMSETPKPTSTTDTKPAPVEEVKPATEPKPAPATTPTPAPAPASNDATGSAAPAESTPNSPKPN